jgi:hypothetical protein
MGHPVFRRRTKKFSARRRIQITALPTQAETARVRSFGIYNYLPRKSQQIKGHVSASAADWKNVATPCGCY